MLKAKSFNLRSFAVDVDVSCDVVILSKFRESIFICYVRSAPVLT